MQTLAGQFMRYVTIGILTVCGTALLPEAGQAQFIQQGYKLVGTLADSPSRQGSSVALSADGNTALVGGPADRSEQGAAWVFTRSGIWTQQGNKLISGSINPDLGTSVALSADGNTAVVGAPRGSGGTLVFTRSGGAWTQQGAALVGTGAVEPPTVSQANQGHSVAVSADGNTLVVGGPGDNLVAGAAWVFTRSGGLWTQQGAKLVGTGAVGEAGQGSSVALAADGNTLVVGGPGDNSGAGAAWVFTRSGGVWTQQGAKLVGTGAVGQPGQARSVALSADGNTLIVGGSSDNSVAGAAWVFTRSGGVWTQQGAKLVGTGAVGQASQGWAVALSADGNTALIGGPRDDTLIGAAWAFVRTGGVWSQQGKKLVAGDASGVPVTFGASVALSADGNTALVGGPWDDTAVGAAWAFVRRPSVAGPASFTPLGFLPGTTQSTANAISADGNVIVGQASASSSSAFRWTESSGMVALPMLSGYTSMTARAVNNDGSVVVGQASNASNYQAFRWTPGGTSGLGYLTGFTTNSDAFGIDASGSRVVGASFNDNGKSRAFRWTEGTFDDVGVLAGYSDHSDAAAVSSDGFAIGGTSCSTTVCQAFSYSQPNMQGLGFLTSLGHDTSRTWGISGDGTVIVGASWNSSNLTTMRAFRTDQFGNMFSLGSLSGGSISVASAASRNGAVIVGTGYDSQGASKAFRWTAAEGMKSIEQLLTQAGGSFAGWSLTDARGVSDDGGTIVGFGSDPNGRTQAWRVRLPGTLSIPNFTDYVVTGYKGGPFSPSAFAYSLNTDVGSVGFSIAGVPDWLTPSATSGTASPISTSIMFTVNANASSRSIGTYGMQMSFTNLTNGRGSDVRYTTLQLLPSVNSHDADGDHKSDVVWRDSGGNTALWLMDGGVLTGSGGFTVPTAWSLVGQRDFNGDGKSDLLWRDTSGNTALWFMNGATLASSGFVGNIPVAWSVVGTADFNGDGKGDLLWRDTSGNTAIWLMNGAAFAGSGGLGTVPTAWSVAATADFDGDDKADILWRDTSGNTAIWFMNGGAVASTAFVGNVSPAWSVVATGDFDGDGRADLVWRDTTGNAAIWLMNGAAVAGTGGLGNVPTAWTLPLTGDFTGDGKSDLLWRHSSGSTAMWFMDGAAVWSTAFVGTIPADWAVQGMNAN